MFTAVIRRPHKPASVISVARKEIHDINSVASNEPGNRATVNERRDKRAIHKIDDVITSSRARCLDIRSAIESTPPGDRHAEL